MNLSENDWKFNLMLSLYITQILHINNNAGCIIHTIGKRNRLRIGNENQSKCMVHGFVYQKNEDFS